MKMALRVAIVAALFLSGCGQLNNVRRVGGAEPATWVYVDQTGFGSAPGIYRCTVNDGKATCKRATIE